MPETWPEVMKSFREHLYNNNMVIGAGPFGSVIRGEDWLHSDLDVLIVLDTSEDHAEAVYSRWQERVIHSQLLSAKSLEVALSRNNYSFLSVVAGMDVWFDPRGILRSAICYAQAKLNSLATSVLLPAQFTAGLASLHAAEKCMVLRQETAAQAALIAALGCLATTKLVHAGVIPPKDVWTSPAARGLPEYDLFRLALRGWESLAPVVEQVWDEVYALLPIGAQPIIDYLQEHGPASYMQLELAQQLAHLKLTERLMEELVNSGLIAEQLTRHSLIAVDEILYHAV